MFTNREEMATSAQRELALDCLQSGIEAAHPKTVVQEFVEVTDVALVVDDTHYDLTDINDILIVGGGNAAGPVAEALEDVLTDKLSGGAVITDTAAETKRVELLAGDHPVPSERGMENTQRMTAVARDADDDDLVLAVITGGGSALMETPMEGLNLTDIKELTETLLDSGLPIHDINTVRKHLSSIKGGRLARTIAPAQTVGLVFSDVVGNDLDVIASGPVSPDESSFEDALTVLETSDITVADTVRSHLERGARGDVEETPGPTDSVFDRVTNHVLADGATAMEAAVAMARERGYQPLFLSSRVRGEAREVAKTHVAIAEESVASGRPVEPPAVVLSGGETTVSVQGEGSGGPNQEFAVSCSSELTERNIVVASVDTDGFDGSTDVAGALVDAETLPPDAARTALETNNAYAVLDEVDAHLRTAETGTNVNDLRIVVIGPDNEGE